MNAGSQTRATALVEDLSSDERGNTEACAEELAPLVYDEMRRLARGFLRRESPGHTLQSVDLVHETYLRLVDQTRVDWRGRSHFFAVAARMMRRILVDHARRRRRQKRGGGWRRVTLADAPFSPDLCAEELLALHQALERLAALDERAARIAEMRFFTGLTIREAAIALGLSTTTVEGDWAHARAWLREALSEGTPS